MKSLIAENNCKNRWYPQSVHTYKYSIKVDDSVDGASRLRSNFAYSMQYIEYIEKQIAELKLSEVILTMSYKSYVITGMGIIEGLFANILHSTGNWNTTEWQEIVSFTANPQKFDGKKVKVETHMFEQVDAYDMRMDLDSMIKKVESKNLLSINHNVFPALKKLRELRNRVHLQLGDNQTDHDYNNFGYEEIQMMRRILYVILTCTEICNNVSVFDFLKPKEANTEETPSA